MAALPLKEQLGRLNDACDLELARARALQGDLFLAAKRWQEGERVQATAEQSLNSWFLHSEKRLTSELELLRCAGAESQGFLREDLAASRRDGQELLQAASEMERRLAQIEDRIGIFL